MSIKALGSNASTENLVSHEIKIDGNNLDYREIKKLTKPKVSISLSHDKDDAFFRRSIDTLAHLLNNGRKIYGVNTLFGGMANIEATDPGELQTQLILSHHAGMGSPLSATDVRLAMLIRANTLTRGASAVRKEVIERYLTLCQLNITPVVKEYGSIGASGDLIPLSSIAGAALGLSNEFALNINNRIVGAVDGLQELALPFIKPQQKEGLALINGTAMLTAIAANNCLKVTALFNYHLILNAICCEVMQCDPSAFNKFIHDHRPHPGQQWTAFQFSNFLKDAKIIRGVHAIEREFYDNELIQDRYSIRCIPQFLGAIVEDLSAINKTVKIEMNSATDNPLIDDEHGNYFHGGNFLGQHVAIAMDKMRLSLALLAKHNEAQIATLIEPSFSRQLPPSLVLDEDKGATVGCKPLQILGNSLIPLLEQNANPITVHFPIHAEQFNQNINSQGFSAAQLTTKSIELYQQHLSCFSLVLIQALHLRARQLGMSVESAYTANTNSWLRAISDTIDIDYNTPPINAINGGKYHYFLDAVANNIDPYLSHGLINIYSTDTELTV